MIVDIVMFGIEFDMLECRLHQLDGIVDRFIVCEADHSFTGIEKPYNLTDALAEGRYSGYPIEVYQARTKGDEWEAWERPWIFPETAKYWWREREQRRAANAVIASLPSDTILIVGDLDEIPRREVITGFSGRAKALVMRHLVYSVRQFLPGPWVGPVIGTRGELGDDAHRVRETHWSFPYVMDAGWHLSWFGGADRRETKYSYQAHQELAAEGKLAERYPSTMTHVDGRTKLMPYDGDFPSWVEEGHAPPEWMESFA